MPQLLVLFLGEIEKNSSASLGDRLVDGLSAGKIRQSAATLYEPNQLVRGSQVQLAGEGSLQIGFEELAVPSLAELEVQIHAVPAVPVAHALQYRRIKNETIHNAGRDGYPGLTLP